MTRSTKCFKKVLPALISDMGRSKMDTPTGARSDHRGYGKGLERCIPRVASIPVSTLVSPSRAAMAMMTAREWTELEI